MPAIAYPVQLRSKTPPKIEDRTVPRLENGDRLTQPEFHRRYLAMPEDCHAELVEGIVYMASPLRRHAHGKPHFAIIGWLAQYSAATPLTDGGDNCSLFLDLGNEVQPDVFLRISEQAGGSCFPTQDDYMAGAPELVIEIAASSANYDLHQKKEAYRRNGVQEYAVWRTQDVAFDWWKLEQGDYVPLMPDAEGCLHSEVFPGLVLDVPALLGERLADVLKSGGRGIGSPEHTAFLAKLNAHRVG